MRGARGQGAAQHRLAGGAALRLRRSAFVSHQEYLVCSHLFQHVKRRVWPSALLCSEMLLVVLRDFPHPKPCLCYAPLLQMGLYIAD